MLTRLRISGFKNLVDVDIRFGPFTCIAFKRVSFGCLPGTWRQNKAQESEQINTIAMGKLLSYLNPVPKNPETTEGRSKQRVIDREDLTPLIPGLSEQLA